MFSVYRNGSKFKRQKTLYDYELIDILVITVVGLNLIYLTVQIDNETELVYVVRLHLYCWISASKVIM